MNKRLYIGNIDYTTTDKELEELFSQEGNVVFAKVITRSDGKSRGFGFVEMSTEEEAQKAIEKFNRFSFKDRELIVNEARPQAKREFNSNPGYRPRRDRDDSGGSAKGDLNFKLRKLRRDISRDINKKDKKSKQGK